MVLKKQAKTTPRPVSKIKNRYASQLIKHRKRIFCYAYQEDLDQAYAFYCSRYTDIKYEEFLNLGVTEISKKLSSIPKSEPLYDIIKSRTINIAKIKDKDEKRYWQEQKRINEIPQIFLSNREIDSILKNAMKNNKIGGK